MSEDKDLASQGRPAVGAAPTYDELLRQNEHLTALAEERWKDAAKLFLVGAGPRAGGFEFELKGTIIPYIAEHLAQTFKGMGAENYLEMGFSHDEIGPFTLTIQRQFGVTPAKRIAELTAELALARAAASPPKAPPDTTSEQS